MFLNLPFTKQLKASSQMSTRFSTLTNLPHIHDNFTFTLYISVLENPWGCNPKSLSIYTLPPNLGCLVVNNIIPYSMLITLYNKIKTFQ